ncbi:hypothetical protein RCIA192 [Methanocella arvoryzae MRE50]|uniref:Uncharacterized protein n=1 Tax=Methanocella arvoryzae (strain DSM 22066 / NBRC 105507 / MRE50) TaxID=351160 RepID=Q0W1Q1_METAR|nr:hypothetical protein RCIA192 [Methanocella arvoryzae MRE50]
MRHQGPDNASRVVDVDVGKPVQLTLGRETLICHAAEGPLPVQRFPDDAGRQRHRTLEKGMPEGALDLRREE